MTTTPVVYLTTGQVAAKLHISTVAVGQLRKKGLPNIGRVGLGILHIEADIEAWLAQRGKS